MRYLKTQIPAVVISALACAAIFLLGCTSEPAASSKSEANRQASVEVRADTLSRARAKYAEPRPVNFPMREALVKYTERQDLLNHPWYIYVMSECYTCPGGISYTYHIGQTYPQSTCNFLGSTEEIKLWKSDGNYATAIKVQAPSLDDIYYGSGATTGGCDYFFFDMATDGMVVLHHDLKWRVSDRLLLLDATPVTVR